KRVRGYVHQQVCDRQHLQRERLHQGRFGLDWSMKQSGSVDIAVSLYRWDHTYHQNTDVELFGHVSKSRQELIELLLAIGKLATATVIDPKAGHDAIDDQKAIFVTRELRRERVKEFELMLDGKQCQPNIKLAALVRTSLFRARP
ncbi:MAG: hypothetical protein Q9191_002794, partial [Dirinaria sp. TL-2023a]